MKSVNRAKMMKAGTGALAVVLAGLMLPATAQQGGLDFRLPPADDGRDSNVQGPSDNGLPPEPAPQPKATVPTPLPTPKLIQAQPQPPIAAPKAATAAPKAATTAAPKGAATAAPKAAASTAQSPTPVVAPAAPVTAPVAELPAQPPVELPLGDGAAVPEAAPIAEPEFTPEEAAPLKPANEDAPWWAWPLVMLVAVGGGYLYWRRQNRLEALELPAPVDDAPQPKPQPKVVPPTPPKVEVQPRPVAQPQPVSTPAPMPAPMPAPRAPEPAPVAPVSSKPSLEDSAVKVAPAKPQEAAMAYEPLPASGFVTTKPLVRRAAPEVRADVAMEVTVRSIRVEADHVAVGFLLTLSNLGSLDAASLMVRIALGQGSAMNEAVLSRFYDGAGGSVLRDDIDLPTGRSEQLSSEVKLPRQTIEPLMMGGKPMMVPVLAADVTYHWEGTGEAFGQIAAAYVLGRAAVGGSGKLAPIPLDQTPLTVDRPDARLTAMTRRQ